MFSGIIRHFPAMAIAVALLGSAAVLSGDIAAADPDQDQKFFDLLGQKDIPPVDNANSLIETAHKACSKLDGGMSVGDLVELIRNNGYNENPLTRLNPPDRIIRTIDQFINASVEAYCPYDRGKIASIAAYFAPGSDAAIGDRPQVVVLASLLGTVPAGEIAPTKPVPVPAQPPPSPEELAPAPQQPPPPPRHVQQAPPRQKQVEPPPEEAPPEEPPPQEPPPQAEPPQAPAPAPQPGRDSGGAPAPESPAPAPPGPPGHIRIAP